MPARSRGRRFKRVDSLVSQRTSFQYCFNLILFLCLKICPACSVPCLAGTFALSGLRCETCSPGTTDHDGTAPDPLDGSSAATPCRGCAAGQFLDSVGAIGECSSCAVGFFGNSSGRTDNATCHACPLGHWSSFEGAPECQACPVSMYRGLLDFGCQVW